MAGVVRARRTSRARAFAARDGVGRRAPPPAPEEEAVVDRLDHCTGDAPVIETVDVGEPRNECIALTSDTHVCNVRTECHELLDGAYNITSTAVVVRDDTVSPAPFAPRPRWQPAFFDDEGNDWVRALHYGAVLHGDGDRVVFEAGYRYRAYGDSANSERYEWRGGRFVPVEVRSRDGGRSLVYPGPLPIVGPPALRCRAALGLRGAARATLTVQSGARASVRELRLSSAKCTAYSDESLLCPDAEGHPEAVEYVLVADGSDWLVLRVTSDGASEPVLRVERGCAL